MKRFLLLLLGFLFLLLFGHSRLDNSDLPIADSLDYLSTPKNFRVQVLSNKVVGARSLTKSRDGVIYIGTRKEGVVYALYDSNGDTIPDKTQVVISELNSPNGVAYHNKDLYIAEIDRVIVLRNIDENFRNSPKYEIVIKQLPNSEHHGWRYLKVGPDSKLYLSIGAPCNVCELNYPFGSIARMNLDGSDFEVIATGIRNSVGFSWSPLDNSLWFTDNGRDWLGDNAPADELNHLSGTTNNFGFPYCHAGEILDPIFGKGRQCTSYANPAIKLAPHAAALGITFYTGSMFPSEYKQKIFIAEHGSWNRKEPIGYRITTVELKDNQAVNYEVFAEGWLDKSGSPLGRPLDILEMNDGSLVVSDDLSGTIYRIIYSSLPE